MQAQRSVFPTVNRRSHSISSGNCSRKSSSTGAVPTNNESGYAQENGRNSCSVKLKQYSRDEMIKMCPMILEPMPESVVKAAAEIPDEQFLRRQPIQNPLVIISVVIRMN